MGALRHAAIAGVTVLLLTGMWVPCDADPVAREGLVFSDELGGFTILQVYGTGTIGDPFVLVEEVTGPQAPILVIRGLSMQFGNRVRTHHFTGFALTKVAINRTDAPWRRYDLELRELLALHSPYGDGLSFGQASTIGRPFQSSMFASNREVDEPFDSISFNNGTVDIGETVAFHIVITEMSPRPVFYLLQEQVDEVAAMPHVPPQIASTSAMHTR